MLLRRTIGITIIIVSVAGLAFGLYSLLWLQGASDRVERDIVSGMDFGLESLEVVSETLQVAILTVEDTASVLDAGVESSRRTQATLDAIGPAMAELGDVVANQLPATLDAVQGAMPSLQQAAGAIDTALRTLNRFQWSAVIPIVQYELNFGLGIDYDPPIPLDESVGEISKALEGLPHQFTGIETSLSDTRDSLQQTGVSVSQVGESLQTVSGDLHRTSAVLDEYVDLVARTTEQVRLVRWNIRDRVRGVALVLSIVLVWLVLSQLAPLYLGCTLVFPRGNPAAGARQRERGSPAGDSQDQDAGPDGERVSAAPTAEESQGVQERPPAEG